MCWCLYYVVFLAIGTWICPKLGPPKEKTFYVNSAKKRPNSSFETSPTFPTLDFQHEKKRKVFIFNYTTSQFCFGIEKKSASFFGTNKKLEVKSGPKKLTTFSRSLLDVRRAWLLLLEPLQKDVWCLFEILGVFTAVAAPLRSTVICWKPVSFHKEKKRKGDHWGIHRGEQKTAMCSFYTWIFQVCKICAFSRETYTKRQKIYMSWRSRYTFEEEKWISKLSLKPSTTTVAPFFGGFLFSPKKQTIMMCSKFSFSRAPCTAQTTWSFESFAFLSSNLFEKPEAFTDQLDQAQKLFFGKFSSADFKRKKYQKKKTVGCL